MAQLRNPLNRPPGGRPVMGHPRFPPPPPRPPGLFGGHGGGHGGGGHPFHFGGGVHPGGFGNGPIGREGGGEFHPFPHPGGGGRPPHLGGGRFGGPFHPYPGGDPNGPPVGIHPGGGGFGPGGHIPFEPYDPSGGLPQPLGGGQFGPGGPQNDPWQMLQQLIQGHGPQQNPLIQQLLLKAVQQHPVDQMLEGQNMSQNQLGLLRDLYNTRTAQGMV